MVLVDGVPTVANTGELLALVNNSVVLRFFGAPARTKILPLEHTIVQSLEIFDSIQDLQLFMQKFNEQNGPAPVKQAPKRKPTVIAAVPDPEPDVTDEELEAVEEAPAEEQPNDPPPPRKQTPEQRLARSTMWRAIWKDPEMSDTYVSGVHSVKDAKRKINATLGTQKESDYLDVKRVLEEDVPETALII